MWIELWVRHIIARQSHDLEVLFQRALQAENPELYVELRGGTGDLGRDLVIKSNRSESTPCGICQVSAERAWQHKFRKELRQLLLRFQRGEIKGLPEKWVFLTTQNVHEKRKPSRKERPRDKDDELAWAQGFLRKQNISMRIEIWGFQDLVALVADPQRGELIRDEFGLSQFFGERVDAWLRAFDVATRAYLDRDAVKMPILGTLQRPESDLLLGTLEGSGSAVLTGVGGAGKTGIVTALALRLQEAGHPILYLPATEFARSLSTPKEVGDHLPMETPLVKALDYIGRIAESCYLFIDQLDFVAGSDLSITLCNLAKIAAAMEGVYVVVVTRPYQARIGRGFRELDFLPKVEVRPLEPGQVCELLKSLGISSPSDDLLALADNILNLSLIAELVEEGIGLGHIDNEPQLWNRYLRSIEEREGVDALGVAITLATESLREGRRDLAILQLDHPTRALISRRVIVQVNGHMYRFRHERLQDYLYAWEATRTRKTASEILADMDEGAAYGVIEWMSKIYQSEAPQYALRFVREGLHG